MSEVSEAAQRLEVAWENASRLEAVRHLGNTVMIGISPSGDNYQQVCWLSSGEPGEQNRRFEITAAKQGEYVQTVCEPDGEPARSYPTMLSLDDMGARRSLHVATTGDRTRAILQDMLPDPNHGRPLRQPFGTGSTLYGPAGDIARVSGLLNLGQGVKNTYGRKETHANFALLTRPAASETVERPLRSYVAPGTAHAAQADQERTGAPDEFANPSYLLPILETAADTRDFWWERLPEHSRIAIAVLAIEDGRRTYSVRNA